MSGRLDTLPQRRLANGLAVAVAHGWRARFLGLAWLDRIDPDRALALEPCRSIHTFGMRFALDLLWLDAERRLLRLDREVPPRCVRACRAARSVIETPAGRADAFLAAGAAGSPPR